MAQIVSDTFREVLYSGEADNTASLTIGDKLIATENIKSIKISSPIIDKTSKNFYLGTFIGQQIDIEFYKPEDIDLSQQVYLEIGTKVNDEYEMIPIGYFNIETPKEDYYSNVQITALDNSTKFKTNIDISDFFNVIYQLTTDVEINEDKTYYTYNAEENTYTVVEDPIQENLPTYYEQIGEEISCEELLKSLCDYYLGENKLGTYPETNKTCTTTLYDNALSGKQYISYIAEMMGGNAKIGRDGKLYIIPLKQQPAVTIEATEAKSWTLGEKYDIKKVTFYDAIRRVDFGDDTGNVLYIRPDNPFVVGEEEEISTMISNIYESVKDTIIYNLTTENYGDYSLDCWDFINYQLTNDDGTVENYQTINNTEITYEMNIASKVDVAIPSEYVEETTNIINSNETQAYNRLKAIIDKVNNQIEILAAKTSQISDEVGNTYTQEQINQLIIDATNGLTNTFSVSGGNNLIHNSSLIIGRTTQTTDNKEEEIENEYEYWDGLLERMSEENSVTGSAILLKKGRCGQTIETLPNEYFLSFKYKQLISLSSFKLTINEEEIMIIEENVSLDEEQEYEYSFVTDNPNIILWFETNTDNGIEIYDLMLNIGTIKAPYSQHENEITTNEVQIGQGITVKSNLKNTTTKIDSDGQRTFNNTTKEIVNRNTDQGTYTKTLEVKEDATINKLYITIVDEEESWITGL